MDGIPADRRRNKSPHQDPLSPGQPRRPAGRGFRRCGTLHETPRNRPLLCACERDPTDRHQLGLPERRNPGPLERRESVPVAGPFAQKEKGQPDISTTNNSMQLYMQTPHFFLQVHYSSVPCHKIQMPVH